MTWQDDAVVVTVAPTGAEVTRADNPALPHTPSEIAADVALSAEAGASVVHLHVREPDGSPSARVELFREAIALIRGRSNIVTMVSTGGAVGMTIDMRTSGLAAGPDLAGVETGSLNFGDDAFVTTPPQARAIAWLASQMGVGLEVEAFEVGHVVAAVGMLERGELAAPLRVNLVFGIRGGIDASPEALASMLRPLPAATHWSITAPGRHQRRMLALALLQGCGGIRVGFEDNVYLARSVRARSNAELVEQACRLVTDLDRRVASIDEARKLLGVPPQPQPGSAA